MISCLVVLLVAFVLIIAVVIVILRRSAIPIVFLTIHILT